MYMYIHGSINKELFFYENKSVLIIVLHAINHFDTCVTNYQGIFDNGLHNIVVMKASKVIKLDEPIDNFISSSCLARPS